MKNKLRHLAEFQNRLTFKDSGEHDELPSYGLNRRYRKTCRSSFLAKSGNRNHHLDNDLELHDHRLHMNRQIVDSFGGLHYGFADGWVSVDNAAEFVGSDLERHCYAGFGQ